MTTQAPFGNIYSAATPTIDRISMLLYNEQKQREQQRQQQMLQMDEEFRKNVSNIRDADIPEFTKKYQDWKRSRQDLMKMNPSNQDAFIAKQLESQRKLADVYQLANASKTAKSEEEELYKGMTSKPNHYNDDAYTLLTDRRKTPLSQLKQYQRINPTTGKVENIDLSNPDSYQFKGIDFDLSKLLKDAKGIPRQTYTKEEPVSGDNLQTKMTPYYFSNSPMDYKNMVLGGLYTRNGSRFAERQYDAMPPDMVTAINEQFKKIPKEKWQQMTGSDTPQDLVINDNDSKAEKYAKHLAQLYAINENPEIRTPQFRVNEANKIRLQQSLEEGKEKRVAAFKKSIGLGENTNGTTTGNALDEIVDAGSKRGTFHVKDGVIYNNDGAAMTGKLYMPGEFVPATVKSALKAGGFKPEDLNRGVDVEVKDGVIQNISNKRIGTITREAMEGVYQPKMDTEPLKGKHLQFGKKGGDNSGAIELSGKVNPSSLIKGQRYKVNGETRIWNGQKLIKE